MNDWIRTIACFAISSLSAGGREAPDLLRDARRALAESIPQVAAQKLEAFLSRPDLGETDRLNATLALGEALLRAREYNEALTAIAPLLATNDRAVPLLHADILAAAGHWSKALPLYAALAEEPGAPPAAMLGEVESLYALGQIARALERLEILLRKMPDHLPVQLRLASLQIEMRQGDKARRTLAGVRAITPGDVKWKKYIEARLLLLDDQPAPALVTFEEIVEDKRDLSENLFVGATLGMTEARIEMNGYEAAEKVLESFIWKNPDSAYLELIFQRLDQIYAQQDDPPEGELQKWTRSTSPRCAALARFYLARLQMFEKKPEKAARSLDLFIAQQPSHPLLPYAHLLQADLLLAKRKLPEAIAALEAAARDATSDELRAEIELRTGFAHYHTGEFLLAGKFFDLAAGRSPKLRETALYNGALASLQLKNLDRFFEQYRELQNRFPKSELRSELLLEQGLLQARTGDARALQTLELFLQSFPRHPRTPEARLALAELAFAAEDTAGAARYLQAANRSPQSVETADQADYLAIFLADAEMPRDERKVVKLATQFIRERPQSPHLAEVRMKLGQVYFRNNDFPNAETQLATLARESPRSAYAESALFLAGQAAMKTRNTGSLQRALDLFDEVAKKDGPLKLPARQQQAIIETGLGKEHAAIALYDIILMATPGPETELRHAALCGKADNLLALGTKEPGQIDAAIAIYDELGGPDVPAAWRNQALYKKAKAFEQQSRMKEALGAYYDVLNQADSDGREYFWLYKAGFEAARIFETQEQWKSAIGIYEKMAKIDGPGSAEARQMAKKLRLERFIWD